MRRGAEVPGARSTAGYDGRSLSSQRTELQPVKEVVIYKVVKVIAAFFLLFGVAAAQDEGLYAPAPPADAAFVRVLNAGTGAVTPTLGETAFGEIAAGTVSPYRVVLQGSAELAAGSIGSTFEVEAGRFYTVALTDEAALLEDPTLQNRAQALLLLYNLSAEPAELKTADGATDVIPAVAPGAVGSIEVNAIAVAFGAFAGDAALAAFDEVQLERGAAYSTFVLPDGAAVFVQSVTTTE